MGKCAIMFDLSENPEVMVTKAGQAILAAGGEFTGDAKEGVFQLSTPIGSVKGAYAIEGSQVSIRIQEKPMLLSCGRIEQTLRSYLKG